MKATAATSKTSATSRAAKGKAAMAAPGITLAKLKAFCYGGNAPEKATYRTAWSKKGFSYATDFRVLLRVKRLPNVAENKEARTAPAESILESVFRRSNKWQALPPLTGKTKAEGLEIGAGFFAVGYLKLLKKLPGLLVAADGSDSFAPLAFKFQDGKGALMPMRREDAK